MQSKNVSPNGKDKITTFVPTASPEIVKKTPIIIPDPTITLTSQIDLLINNPTSGEEVNSSSVTVKGTTGKNVNVIVNDQELISNIDGVFKTEVPLDEGENYISIVAYDDFGNSAEREILVSRTIRGL